MGRFQYLQTWLPRSVRITAALLAIGGATTLPAQAAPNDFVYNCAPGQSDTGTVSFHPMILGVDSSMMDGTRSEFDFGYQIAVTQYDPAKPGWTGPQLCAFTDRWEWDVDEPNAYGDMVPFKMGRGMVINNVPRDARVHYSLFANERDTLDPDDWADFNPSPTGSPRLELDVFVATGEAQTMVGAAQGIMDVNLGLAKRIQGDGRMSQDHDHFRAYLEFIVDVNIKPAPSGAPMIGTGPTGPGQAIGGPNAALVKQVDCQAYADKAVALTDEAQKLGCGFTPPVWSKDGPMHFNWCMQGNNFAGAAPANVQRAADLQACAAQKGAQPAANLAVCAIYAAEATASATEADQLGCGFGGGRWSTDYGGHFAWCMAGANPVVMVAETASRASQLAGCIAAKGGN